MTDSAVKKTWQQYRPKGRPYEVFRRGVPEMTNNNQRRALMKAFFQWLEPQYSDKDFHDMLQGMSHEVCRRRVAAREPISLSLLACYSDLGVWRAFFMKFYGLVEADVPKWPWHGHTFSALATGAISPAYTAMLDAEEAKLQSEVLQATQGQVGGADKLPFPHTAQTLSKRSAGENFGSLQKRIKTSHDPTELSDALMMLSSHLSGIKLVPQERREQDTPICKLAIRISPTEKMHSDRLHEFQSNGILDKWHCLHEVCRKGSEATLSATDRKKGCPKHGVRCYLVIIREIEGERRLDFST